MMMQSPGCLAARFGARPTVVGMWVVAAAVVGPLEAQDSALLPRFDVTSAADARTALGLVREQWLDPRVMTLAAEGVTVLPAVLEVANDPTAPYMLRISAVEVLGLMRHPDGVAPLKELWDRGGTLGIKAREALRLISGEGACVIWRAILGQPVGQDYHDVADAVAGVSFCGDQSDIALVEAARGVLGSGSSIIVDSARARLTQPVSERRIQGAGTGPRADGRFVPDSAMAAAIQHYWCGSRCQPGTRVRPSQPQYRGGH